MNLYAEISELIKLAERGKPSLATSGLWKNKVLGVLRLANRADLELRYRDGDTTGACDGPWEEEEWQDDQGMQSGQGMNRTRIEHLRKRQADTSRSSTERTRTASVTVLKP